jgi:Fe-S-cluster-containing hydrogenase component 2
MRPNVHIDPALCHTCERCQARSVCRTRAILQLEPADLPIVEVDRCRGCLVCLPACPYGAVTGPASAREQPRATPPPG